MTKLLALALCVCLVMSMSVKERLEKSEALKESAETQEENSNGFCFKRMIGNKSCEWQCNYKEFEWDGGDCCAPDKIGDLVCDDPCNLEKFNFDGGDCGVNS